jgi:ubiquinone/menaquinone biosynthesis C-methylase UbiE
LNGIRVYENPLFESLTGSTIRPGGLDITKRGMEFCTFPKNARLLDIGCGKGASVEYIAGEYGYRCTGIDSSAYLINEGLRRNRELLLIEGKAEKLPFKDCGNEGCFDGILTECSLSLMNDKPTVLDEIKRVMKKKGFWIISDIYIRNGKQKSSSNLQVHTCLRNAFNLNDLRKLLLKNGFNILLLEDHTRALKETMANIILEYGSVDIFWKRILGGSHGCEFLNTQTKGIKFGYFLMVVQKR